MDKIIVNIVYNCHSGPPSLHYENDKGIVQISNVKIQNGFNVFMGLASVYDPVPGDSLYVLEPRCVVESEYCPNLINQFQYIFTWADQAYANTEVASRVVPINHPSCLGAPSLAEVEAKWLPWSERSNEIVFIANNKHGIHNSHLYDLRIELADLFHGYSRKFKVSWYGQIPLRKPYYKGRIDSKFDVLKSAKFSICMENCYDSTFSRNYFTEKMPEVLFAGTVPVYMGCHNIDDFALPESLYLDLRKFVYKSGKAHQANHDALIEAVHSYDEGNYQNMLSALRTTSQDPTGIYHLISYPRVYSTMIESFLKQ